MKSDAKFEEKLTLGSKNDIMNLVKFNSSCSKSENLHFHVLLSSKIYQVRAKKVQRSYVITLKIDQNFEEKLNFCMKNDMRNLASFNTSGRKPENLHFDELLL